MSIRYATGASGRYRSARGRGMTPALLGAAAVLTGLLSATDVDASYRFERGDRIDRGGVVYAMTNADERNEIRVYHRDRNGRLRPIRHATTPTGGSGAGGNAAIDPLGSQGALVYDEGVDMLFAVNAGDDTVTAFGAGPFGVSLRRRAHVASGGQIPVSLAVSEDRLYVLNAGGSGTVATFEIGAHGTLTQIGMLDLGIMPGYASAPPFNQVAAPGQVGVDALARNLIVTHLGGQELLVAELDDDGVPVGPLTSTSTPNPAPFAFGTTRYGSTLVANAAGFVTAFDPPAAGSLAFADSVATNQTATCWIVVGDSGFAYVSNTGSDTLSRVAYSRTGQLDPAEVVATTSGAPIDMTFANAGGFLYALDAASGSISGFVVDAESGELAHVETQSGLPSAGLQGIAARDF